LKEKEVIGYLPPYIVANGIIPIIEKEGIDNYFLKKIIVMEFYLMPLISTNWMN
jgi:hypothetical protein